MEQAIIEVIDKKALRKYERMTEIKAKAYRAMLYAGVQVTLNGCTVREIAPEIGYTESGASKLVQKFINLISEGDVIVNQISVAYHKLPMSKRYQHGKSGRVKIDHPDVITASNPSPKRKASGNTTTKSLKVSAKKALRPAQKLEQMLAAVRKEQANPTCKLIGWTFTREDLARERRAIRSAIRFFQDYGKGAHPKSWGGVYETTPNQNKKEIWLPLYEAARYCGVPDEAITIAGDEELIGRRKAGMYTSAEYEYDIEDLDLFIKRNKLL